MFGLKLSFKRVEKNVYDVGIGKKAESRHYINMQELSKHM
jgi:hypothetical protein